MALYTMHVARDQEHLEKLLVQSRVDALPSVGPAVPHIVGSLCRLVQLCGYACHGRFVALRGLHFLAVSECL
jgi:hypothetical protein